jgi:hypothetical protein
VVFHESEAVPEASANATVNREVELLHGAFSLGVKSGRIVRMAKFPEKLPEKNARQGFFETGDFRKILPFLASPWTTWRGSRPRRAGAEEC